MLISADGLSQPKQRTSIEIEVPRIERFADRGRRLCGPLQPEHAFIPSLTREPVGLLAGSPRLLRCGAVRTAVDCFRYFVPISQRRADGVINARLCGPTAEKADCKSGRISAPLWPQALQTNHGSISDSCSSPGRF